MSGVSLDVRDRGDRGRYGCPYRALTRMEWCSRGLSPAPGARAREEIVVAGQTTNTLPVIVTGGNPQERKHADTSHPG